MDIILRLPRTIFWATADACLRVENAFRTGKDAGFKDGKKIKSEDGKTQELFSIILSSINDMGLRVGNLVVRGEDVAFKDGKIIKDDYEKGGARVQL